MLNKAEDSQISPLHRTRLIIRAGLLAMWTVGVVVAIRSGWDPGPWWDKSLQQWHYPLRQVLIEIAKITLISFGLYDVLRPRPDTSSFGRTVRALAVLLVTLLWVEMVSWTDQAAYAYAVGIYVLFVTRLLFLVLLCQVVVVGVSAIRGVVNRWRHAA